MTTQDLINRLRDTASKGVSVWGDLQMEAAKEIETLLAERECYASAMDRMQAALAEPSEPKMPPFFTQIEWLGNQARVHVFQRREDETPLNVCSQTHPASKPSPLTADEVWKSDAIMAVNASMDVKMNDLMKLVRAIEAAVWAKFAAVKQDAAIKEKFE